MIKNFARLFVLALALINGAGAGADSLFIPVKGNACINVTSDRTRSAIRYQAYDKAALMAVKSSEEISRLAQNSDEHNYTLLAYKLVDKALQDVTVTTIRDDNKKICLEISGRLDKAKADAILREKQNTIDTETVKNIADKVNATLPKSIYETDETIPLLYIEDLKYYNGKTSSSYTAKLAEKLAFEPRVLVTENKELADYILIPRLLLSKIEPLNQDNSRYSMSVVVEVRKNNGELVDSEQQNRYILINKKQDAQQTAHKLLQKLLEDALNNMSGKLNRLLKY